MIRRPYWLKYCKNEHQEATSGKTGSRNMAVTRYFDSATLTSYLTPYTLWGLYLTITELVLAEILLELSLLHYLRVS